MRLICLPLTLLLLTLLPALAGHKPPQIFFRMNVQTTGEGMPSTQVTTVALPPDGETILVRTLPEVTEHELVGIQSDPATGGIRLIFNHQGKVNLSAVTGQNEGRILVVMIDGVVTYAPVIDEQITTGEFVIPHPINPQVIALLQQMAQDNVKEAKR